MARVAVAGALAAIPLAAVAGPALADTAAPSATQTDRHHDDWDHHGPDVDPGWWNHGFNHGPWAPPTGSAG